MKRVTVASSNVAEVGYDPTRRVLEVLFRSGGLYQYFDVPEAEYTALCRASSVGGYLNQNIKGRFRYSRI